MNHPEYKNLQTVADEHALLIDLRKADEGQERNRTGVLNRSQKKLPLMGKIAVIVRSNPAY